jgi:hypothetical protein
MECPFETGDLETIKKLCDNNDICINAPYCSDYTPLVTSILFKHYHITLYLLEKDADPNIEENDENTTLFYLCSNMNNPPLPIELILFERILSLSNKKTINMLYTLAVQNQYNWLRAECRKRMLQFYSIQTMLAAIETHDMEVIEECKIHVSPTETGLSQYGLVTPFELICHMINDKHDLTDLFNDFLPFYKDQLTYHKLTCFHLVCHTPLVRIIIERMNPLLFLYKDPKKEMDFFQEILSWRDTDLMYIILPRLPCHVRFYYLLSRDPWIHNVPLLRPLLDVFLTKERTMDSYDLETGYRTRFDPFLE